MPLMALTPTSSTSLMGPRSMGLMGRPCRLSTSRHSGGGLPSSGWPRPSMMRPNKSGPRHTCEVWLSTRTCAPGPMPCGSVKGSKNSVSSLKPTTSASTRWPIWPTISQHAPNGAIRPRVSSRMPTSRTKVPLRWGSGACRPPISWLTSCSKFMPARSRLGCSCLCCSHRWS